MARASRGLSGRTAVPARAGTARLGSGKAIPSKIQGGGGVTVGRKGAPYSEGKPGQ